MFDKSLAHIWRDALQFHRAECGLDVLLYLLAIYLHRALFYRAGDIVGQPSVQPLAQRRYRFCSRRLIRTRIQLTADCIEFLTTLFLCFAKNRTPDLLSCLWVYARDDSGFPPAIAAMSDATVAFCLFARRNRPL